MIIRRYISILFWASISLGLFTACGPDSIQFAVSFPDSLSQEPLDGRILLLISDNNETEPRFQISDGPGTQMVFGMDINALKAGDEAIISDTIFGYPLQSLNDIPPGEYYVQALLHKYETFNLSTGHTVKLPMDQGEGQQWNHSPGNYYSTPQKVVIDPAEKETIHISLENEIPPIEEPEDTKYIKHIKIQSKLLSDFWGRPMYLGAHVLLPEGFEEHPNARYPLAVFHGHFPYTFEGFRVEPPDPNLEADYNERFDLEGYNKIQQEEAHNFYKTWTGPGFPRMLIIEIQHQNPYYDDSYAVNSANLGPYGDAITYELIPYIEKQFRGIGEGWARFLYGGSTGGWEALAAQVMYPDEYNACFAACPDPIDFRAYTVVDIYQDSNAYFLPSKYKKTPRPGQRDYLGHVSTTLQDMNYKELALGTKSRSGQQWDIWQAVYSPAGADGYPKPIWDKLTGEIDHSVAAHWKENYDLRHILERDWDKLGPKLQGKIHIYCGDMDNYYLNNAVMLMEDFLEGTENPYYEGEIAYGDGAEHCWNGDPELPNAISRLRYNTMYVPKMMERIRESAPAGADLTSWRY
ncbi:alpha/beta hydrolase-fold protein [Catalinimonas niigatensis]|uniref:alpha/beta hydrolase-fold protein n=1 Tax=Catalinimonas niigatensis TaxID=1397264 RepID=UPI0026655A12|nr:alpha/beta hydrolase-fold protein [Catalinimonas niigatensis]WPP50386.1 alpha/beta hydrolase-fold protein [Catalinimonas niigatensis]